nr:hypothetical protein [Tanacetum cinerariifolium]
MIYVDNLKMDSKNDNENVNIPSFPLPKPTVSYFDDLDFFKDFENEFPGILYNGTLTSKSDFLIEPTFSPQHINEFDLIDETSLSECDEEEQNVMYFTNLFPFNIIHPDEIKSDKDNDDNEIDIMKSSGDFDTRLARIYKKEVHRVQVFDFRGFPDLMANGLRGKMLMEHKDAQGKSIPDKGNLRDYWVGISSVGDFLGTTLSYTSIRDLILRLCHMPIACSIAVRSQAPENVTMTDLFNLRGIDVDSVNHFGLLTEERLQGLTVIVRELPFIDMLELVRLQICKEIDDTWA